MQHYTPVEKCILMNCILYTMKRGFLDAGCGKKNKKAAVKAAFL